MDKQPMDKSNEVVKTNGMQELNMDGMVKVSGGTKYEGQMPVEGPDTSAAQASGGSKKKKSF
jgi:hypothetical protein